MDVMHGRVDGLDVHKGTIVACVRIMAGRKATRECRTFETTTEGLEALLNSLTFLMCAGLTTISSDSPSLRTFHTGFSRDALAGAIAEIDQEVDAAILRMGAEVVAGRAPFAP